MLSERLQILLTPEQKHRLDAEARARSESVGALVREAIDHHFGGPGPQQREQALARIRARRVPHVSPQQLEELLDERVDERWPSDERTGRRA